VPPANHIRTIGARRDRTRRSYIAVNESILLCPIGSTMPSDRAQTTDPAICVTVQKGV